MSSNANVVRDERANLSPVRALAEQAFSRAAGAPLISGNRVRLLKDAQENYPAWLQAISSAKRHVHFESYFIQEDSAGREFAEAMSAKAREGVHVRLIYDWLGGLGKTSHHFWNQLRASGVEVRCYNPPRLDSPVGWLSRDHRKLIAVDGEAGFISGLCVGWMWVGQPEKQIAPWRDTGIEVRGHAVAEIETAFAQIWATLAEPIPPDELVDRSEFLTPGDVSLRVVATMPATAGVFRFDQLVAALARKRLWITDAYYAGTTVYLQALRAAAADGVDVRLLVPNGTDIPVIRPLSRAGYRPLLDAGVRVFEWNGTMLHAKTAVADGHWARVGSSNLNIASWLGNCELDAIIEDDGFAAEMEEMYLEDLSLSTEVVLDHRLKVRVPGQPGHRRPALTSGSGRTGRAAAGAIRVGNALGAAFTNRRPLGPVEARLMTLAGFLLLGLAVLFALFPKFLVYPAVAVCGWTAITLFQRALKLFYQRRRKKGADSKLQGAAKLGREVPKNQD